MAAAIERETPKAEPAVDRPTREAANASTDLTPIAAIGFGLTLLAGIVIAFLIRRRPEAPAPADEPGQPAPRSPATAADIEAELQEMLAEEEAARVLSRPRARR